MVNLFLQCTVGVHNVYSVYNGLTALTWSEVDVLSTVSMLQGQRYRARERTDRDTEQVSGQTEIQSKRGDRQRYIARVGTYRDTEQEWGHTEI